MRRLKSSIRVAALGLLAGAGTAAAATITVPGDHSTVQAALDVAVPGDTIEVSTGTYFEKIVFTSGGTALDGPIVLRAAAGASPVLDGTGVAGANMVLIDGKSHVAVEGFEIRNNLSVNDGSGIRVLGAGTDIEIRDNVIHDMRGQHAMGITVYGTEPSPIENLIIDGNQIFDCEPASSEALTLNGNVRNFEVTNNLVRDVNNIGIDFIGGETDIQPDPALVARDGLCADNVVIRANSSQGGGFAAGIYVDGGRDIIIERNVVTESDLGIEIGAENAGIVTSGVVVRDNLIHRNGKTGIVFGGFAASVGRANGNFFLNNTLYENDTLHEGFGELWIQHADGNVVRNNVFHANGQNLLTYSENGNTNNDLDYNLWFVAAGDGSARFVWRGTEYTGLVAFQAGSGGSANALFADPAFVDPGAGDLHIASTSPAVDAGDPAFIAAPGETDIDGAPRVIGGRVDIGADELSCGDGNLDPGEECDDGNPTDGDGCDTNCTFTACGNGIATPSTGEQCDDANTANGDCCDDSCQFELAGGPCDDGEVCTRTDSCDGAGLCAGDAQPAAGCLEVTLEAKASIDARDLDGSERDRLKWKWSKGAVTTGADLGDPTQTTTYSLCAYDEASGGASTVVWLAASVPPGGTCAGKPCWKALGNGGFKYKDKNAVREGVRDMKLTPGAAGKAKLLVKGRGSALELPALPPAQSDALTVQLEASTGACWTSRFPSPALRADPERFKDKGD